MKSKQQLTQEQWRTNEYLRHGYFGGRARISGGVVYGITYWEPPALKIYQKTQEAK